MPTLSLKIAIPIIITGLFIIVSFIALNYNNLNTSFYIIFAFLVAYVFLFGFATGQNVTLPIRKLLKKADNLSRGDLKSRFYSESKDELGQLGNVFNNIADQLQKSSSENERIKNSVAIKVEAQTQSLKEIINALEQKVQNRTLEIQKMMADLERTKKNLKMKETETGGAELTQPENQVMEPREKPSKRGAKENKKPEAKMGEQET